MTADQAASIAQDALIWLAAEPEALERFMASSGLAPEMMRNGAFEPEFLGFVLEFILSSDGMVLDFATSAGLRPEDPLRARVLLAGSELPNWT